jgi:hypothetical protein
VSQQQLALGGQAVSALNTANIDLISSLVSALPADWTAGQSVAGLAAAALQFNSMTGMLRSFAPYGAEVSAFMDFELGAREVDVDNNRRWRNARARQDHYRRRGMQPELVEVDVRVVSLFSLLEEHDGEFTRATEDSAAIIGRFIRVMEDRMRSAVNVLMTRAYGPDWIDWTVPPRTKKKWLDKKARALEQRAIDKPLVNCADPGQLWNIVENNFEMFAPAFGDPEALRHSRRKLLPVRHAWAHADEITGADMAHLPEFERVALAFASLLSEDRDRVME